MEDFIGIKRKISEHWVYKDSQYFHAWFEMLRRARFSKEPKTDVYEGIIYTLNYAEFIYGRPSWSKRLNIPEQKLRTLVRQLISAKMITLKEKYSKFTIYKIVNYEKYNLGGMFFECTSDVLQSIHDAESEKSNHHDNQQPDLERSSVEANINQQNNQQPTSSQPAANQQPTNKEEGSKKEENDNKKDICAFFELIWNLYPNKKGKGQISDTQKSKLYKIGSEELSRCIDRYRCSKEDWKAWQHGSTFFNSGYVDYLDRNYEKPQEQSKYPNLTNYEPGG